MRRVILLLLSGMIWGFTASTEAVPAKAMSVQVRSSPMRDTPSFMGRVLGTADYGAQVESLQTKGAWVQVRMGQAEGWIHQSALTTRHIEMAAGTRDVTVTASANELALAGKGFTRQVESEFKEKNKEIDFTWVNRMEAFKVRDAEVRDFLKEGRVLPAGGD